MLHDLLRVPKVKLILEKVLCGLIDAHLQRLESIRAADWDEDILWVVVS